MAKKSFFIFIKGLKLRYWFLLKPKRINRTPHGLDPLSLFAHKRPNSRAVVSSPRVVVGSAGAAAAITMGLPIGDGEQLGRSGTVDGDNGLLRARLPESKLASKQARKETRKEARKQGFGRVSGVV